METTKRCNGFSTATLALKQSIESIIQFIDNKSLDHFKDVREAINYLFDCETASATE